jgi:hypothetical protein
MIEISKISIFILSVLKLRRLATWRLLRIFIPWDDAALCMLGTPYLRYTESEMEAPSPCDLTTTTAMTTTRFPHPSNGKHRWSALDDGIHGMIVFDTVWTCWPLTSVKHSGGPSTYGRGVGGA